MKSLLLLLANLQLHVLNLLFMKMVMKLLILGLPMQLLRIPLPKFACEKVNQCLSDMSFPQVYL
ncbi:hypothetical protein CSSP291_15870 [Cronobacter sakazakii SP291]|nr:hypothetical protein CSSP291_15870 [Cronobacter sakazakii SP291]ALB51923.1 hypothetical protein AFK64_15580 [Cronobacter sakazakii]KZE20733.1 hypothetical protein AVZ29_11005 [Cronobacter sakazakii]